MSAFERALRRGDDLIFDTVTLQNQVAQTDGSGNVLRDEHGNIRWDTPTTTEVAAEVVSRGRPTYAQHVAGLKEEVDGIVWISNPNATFTSGKEEDVKATRVIDGDKVYVVFEIFDEHNGRLRGHVRLEPNATA